MNAYIIAGFRSAVGKAPRGKFRFTRGNAVDGLWSVVYGGGGRGVLVDKCSSNDHRPVTSDRTHP